jgi:hypothetical protein
MVKADLPRLDGGVADFSSSPTYEGLGCFVIAIGVGGGGGGAGGGGILGEPPPKHMVFLLVAKAGGAGATTYAEACWTWSRRRTLGRLKVFLV